MVKALPSCTRGFTLIEAIIVIVITGIIASMVAVFIKTSVESYVTTAHRAELTEAADIALRRLSREVRLAVPNSVRVTYSAPNFYLEFVPTKDGGRYRNEGDGSTSGNYLCDGGTVNASFDVVGPMPAIVAGDSVVVFNDASLNGAPCSTAPTNVYCGGSRAAVTNAASPLSLSAAFANGLVICPYANNRFQVVDHDVQAVTYACSPAAPGALTRYQAYGFNSTQATPPAGGTSATIIGNATCEIDYTQNVQQRNGLLVVRLTVTDTSPGITSGEQIVVFRQIHVDNAP